MNGVTIYSKNKTGKTLIWKAETDLKLDSNGHIPLNIYYGQENGKIQHKIRYTKSGKNAGKANATTIEEQALLDISYLYRAQLEEKGYFKSLDDYQERRTAMLAHKFADKKHKLNMDENEIFLSEYFAQPKLNGIRCTATKIDDTKIVFLSRTNKEFTSFEHIEKELLEVLDVGDMVDGELFNKSLPLEHIASLVNSKSDRYVVDPQTGATLCKVDDLQFHLYDAVPNNKNTGYTARREWIQNLFKNNTFKSLIEVLTLPVKSLEEVREYFADWIQKGYEGLMLRDGRGVYEYDQRSIYLLKYKEMLDEEFEIVEIIESENEPGQPVFVVDLRNGEFCKVRKSGEKKENEKYLQDPTEYTGKWLTVQYQARTEYDNLSFPVGLLLREGEFKNGEFVPAT